MPKYHSLCESHMLDPSQMYVAAEKMTQHTLPTSDMQFQCEERERGLVHIVQAVAEQYSRTWTKGALRMAK